MKLPNSTDRIEKQIQLKAPLARVWSALTDYRQFGQWFGVNLEGPFASGQVARGKITYPGYEHVTMEVVVQKIEPERFFSYTWHPYAIDPKKDYSKEPSTLVEFQLEPKDDGTLLTVTETGFDKLPADRLPDAFRMNNDGWEEQLQNIQRYVEQSS